MTAIMNSAGALFALIRRAFLQKEQSEAVRVKTRRSRIDDAATGDEAAAKYLRRRQIHVGRPSSLRKLARAERIKAGQRPLKFGAPTKRERRIALKQKAKRS